MDFSESDYKRLKNCFIGKYNSNGVEVDKLLFSEVNTPLELRQQILSKIPDAFWTCKKKVFEPCCGKGGFVIDIIEKFLEIIVGFWCIFLALYH